MDATELFVDERSGMAYNAIAVVRRSDNFNRALPASSRRLGLTTGLAVFFLEFAMGAASLKATEFKSGDRVEYIPTHAAGDRFHKDVETGTVSSVGNADNVFVKFDKQVSVLGWAAATSQSCYSVDLRKI